MRQAKPIVAPAATKPKRLGTQAIVFNAGAVVLMAAGAYTGVRTLMFPPQAETCLARYDRSTTLPLQVGGKERTAADFQAQSNGRDAGVLENLTVRREGDGPIKTAMQIKFAENSDAPSADGQATGGIKFPWESQMFQGKQAACLSYSIFIPADFKFGYGGQLPGFVSMAEGQALEGKAGFDIRPVWTGPGAFELSAYVNNPDSDMPNFIKLRDYMIPRDRWVRIEQELALNTPGQRDGINRLWADGLMIAEETNAYLRRSGEVRIGHIGVDVHFGGRGLGGVSPQNQTMSVGTIEMRWK